MRTGLVTGIVLGSAAVGFGGGYAVASLRLNPGHGQAMRMRDDLRTATMHLQGLPPSARGPAADRYLTEMNAAYNSSRSGR